MRIIFALVTLVAASLLTFATTRAVWTDAVTVSNNQIQTGTADLQVSTAGIGGGAWDTSSKTASIVLSNLIPGGSYKDNYDFSLWNNSTTGVNFNISAQMTTVSGATGVDQSKLLLALYENGQDPNTQGSGWISLADWQTTQKSLNSLLNSAAIKDYRLAAKLDSTATNEWQGKTVNVTFTVVGTQP
jgi:predicted ribosomally synthesized peptide with SipW-like signal peptide